MSSNRYFEIEFKGVAPHDWAILEKWYSMTDQFGYATGFKDFNEIRDRISSAKSPYEISSMIFISGREEAAGFINAEIKQLDNKMVLWINIIIIDPAFQGRGLGTCVVNKLSNYVKLKFGAIASLVSVSEKNKKGLGFWDRRGFTRCSDLEESLSTLGTTGVAIMKRIIK